MQTQWVLLDFDPATSPQFVDIPGETIHTYSAADQAAILAGLQQIYAAFPDVQFTLTAPTSAEAPDGYETVYYNSTPIDTNGNPQPGGKSSEIDFRNLNLNTVVQVDVNDFLGNGLNQVPDTNIDFQNLSITISAHELGHTLGLRHEDAFGPIGFGISNPPGLDSYYPADIGLVGAFDTQTDIIASPASVGSTLANAASGQASIGERDAVKFAFITDGTVVDGTNPPVTGQTDMTTDGPYTVSAAADQSDTLNVDPESSGGGGGDGPGAAGEPVRAECAESHHHGRRRGQDVRCRRRRCARLPRRQPVTVRRCMTQRRAYTQTAPDYYTFQGQAGELMTFEAMSAAVTRISNSFDTVMRVYDPNGNLIASNDDQFEPSDSTILDLKLPTSGTYTVEVDAFHTTDPSFNNPSSSNYDPAAYYDAMHGQYESFMYSFAALQHRNRH